MAKRKADEIPGPDPLACLTALAAAASTPKIAPEAPPAFAVDLVKVEEKPAKKEKYGTEQCHEEGSMRCRSCSKWKHPAQFEGEIGLARNHDLFALARL